MSIEYAIEKLTGIGDPRSLAAAEGLRKARQLLGHDIPIGDTSEATADVVSYVEPPDVKKVLDPIRREFDDYDPTATVVYTGRTKIRALSPSFAHRLQTAVLPHFSDETELDRITDSEEFRNQDFNDRERGRLTQLFNQLWRDGLRTVVSVKEATSRRLLDVRGAGPRGVVFLEKALPTR